VLDAEEDADEIDLENLLPMLHGLLE